MSLSHKNVKRVVLLTRCVSVLISSHSLNPVVDVTWCNLEKCQTESKKCEMTINKCQESEL